METPQINFWKGNFGKEYTERNSFDLEEWNKLYISIFGVTKIQMNQEFIGDLPKDIKVLEVGCNIGLQLMALQKMGFTNLWGLELQEFAVEKAKSSTHGMNIIQGSGFDIPFKDRYFDMVYTSGVLIHIAPDDLPVILNEMYRCTSKYIWGFEYYSPEFTEINYRNKKGFLWKGDYAKFIQETFSDIRLIKKKLFPYINKSESGNVDSMYLFEKVK
jgi:pseudaminic acid biosynthesis-associated methylase